MPHTYRIHPSVGIARVGNLNGTGPDDFFLGPEAPGHAPVPPGGYKKAGAVKRQGARFRVYEYAPDPQSGAMVPVREITGDDARIQWTVRLGNRKAFGNVFPPAAELRNASIPAEERRRLLILEAEAGIANDEAPGARRSLDAFFLDQDDTRPETHRVHLGDLLLDDAGRLILLGGLGRSFSPTGMDLDPQDIFNNDEWCDDTSDGVITATVTLNGSAETLATEFPARLLVGPPDFAPAIGNVVTLYDLAEDIGSRLPGGQDPLPGAAAGVSFARHIFPLLRRVAQMRWVSRTAESGHGDGQGGDFLQEDLLALLRDPSPITSSPAFRARRKVVSRLRVPQGVTPPADLPMGIRNMPRLNAELDSGRELTLTPLQYERMTLWWHGQFDPDLGVDLDAPAPLFEQIADPREQVRALDRAGLESCVGGSFFPGIEGSRRLRDPGVWAVPFRLRSDLEAGEITEGMSLPWQTDFLACADDWWPAQRPNHVRVRNLAPPPALIRAAWDRQSGGDAAFVGGNWAKMGFVVPDGAAFVEDERGEDLHVLMLDVAPAALREEPLLDVLFPEPPLGDPTLLPGGGG
jgi:hypothetical protein